MGTEDERRELERIIKGRHAVLNWLLVMIAMAFLFATQAKDWERSLISQILGVGALAVLLIAALFIYLRHARLIKFLRKVAQEGLNKEVHR